MANKNTGAKTGKKTKMQPKKAAGGTGTTGTTGVGAGKGNKHATGKGK